jgi:hypothetical protein
LFTSVDHEGRRVSTVEALYAKYLDDVVGRHVADQRIYAWDLCNEPLMGSYVDDPDSILRIHELRWLKWTSDKVRSLGVSQPITLGCYSPGLTVIVLTEPLVDIVSFHPYYMWNGDPARRPLADKAKFEAYVESALEIANGAGKGLVASETVWGARDDAIHVEVMRYTLGVLAERKIGFTVHALHHSLVADLHRDEYGPVGWPETLHFIEADGSLRNGHEAFNEFAPSRTRQW